MSNKRTEHTAHHQAHRRNRHAHDFSGESIHDLMAAFHLFTPLPALARRDGQTVFGAVRPQATLQDGVLRAVSQAEGRLLALGLKLGGVAVREVQTGPLGGPGLDAWREAHEAYMLGTTWVTMAREERIRVLTSEIRARCPGLPHKLEKQLARHFALVQSREEAWKLLQSDPELSDAARAELTGRPPGNVSGSGGRRNPRLNEEEYGLWAGPLNPEQAQAQWTHLTTYLRALSAGLTDWMNQTQHAGPQGAPDPQRDPSAQLAFDAAIRPERRAEITALRTGVQISEGYGLHVQMWAHLAPMVNIGLLPQITPVPRASGEADQQNLTLIPLSHHDTGQPKPPRSGTHHAEMGRPSPDQISPDSTDATPYLNLIQAVTGQTLTGQMDAGQTFGQVRQILREEIGPCWSALSPKRDNDPSADQRRRAQSVLAALSLPQALIGEALELLRDLPGAMWPARELDPCAFSEAHLSSQRDLTAVPGPQRQARP